MFSDWECRKIKCSYVLLIFPSIFEQRWVSQADQSCVLSLHCYDFIYTLGDILSVCVKDMIKQCNNFRLEMLLVVI